MLWNFTAVRSALRFYSFHSGAKKSQRLHLEISTERSSRAPRLADTAALMYTGPEWVFSWEKKGSILRVEEHRTEEPFLTISHSTWEQDVCLQHWPQMLNSMKTERKPSASEINFSSIKTILSLPPLHFPEKYSEELVEFTKMERREKSTQWNSALGQRAGN